MNKIKRIYKKVADKLDTCGGEISYVATVLSPLLLMMGFACSHNLESVMGKDILTSLPYLVSVLGFSGTLNYGIHRAIPHYLNNGGEK